MAIMKNKTEVIMTVIGDQGAIDIISCDHRNIIIIRDSGKIVHIFHDLNKSVNIFCDCRYE